MKRITFCWLPKDHEGECDFSLEHCPCSCTREYLCGKGFEEEVYGCDPKPLFPELKYVIKRVAQKPILMDTVQPKAFSRGKRGIASSMLFLTFDRGALHE